MSTVTQTTVNTSSQYRTGTTTTVLQKIDTVVVDDKTIATAMIPFIRARNVAFVARGCKPQTRFYCYFDAISVDSYIVPAIKVQYTPTAGTFTDSANTGINSNVLARCWQGGNVDVALNKGDVITFANGNTAVVQLVTTELIAGVTTNFLYVQNPLTSAGVVTTLGTGTITGSVSGATGTVTAVTVPPYLQSGFNGDVVGIFSIPNNERDRFQTGTRELYITDKASSSDSESSYSRKTYSAIGVLNTKQLNVLSVRNAEIVQSGVSDTRTISTTSTRTWETSPPRDPLAQTFFVQNSIGGAFITKLDLFFAQKDSAIPVTVEIREVVNGYPTNRVIPFSRVTIPAAKVLVSTNVVSDALGAARFLDLTNPTTVTFPSPVYLKPDTEYAVAILSDSNQYLVWISQTGDRLASATGAGNFISENPYIGVLFKSSNNSTWTPFQNQDLCFRLWKAQFTSVVSSIDLVNDNVPAVTLGGNPFYVTAAVTAASVDIRVNHPNHNMFAGSKVIFSGATAANGITAAQMNTTQTIVSVEADSYIINLTSTGTTTVGYFGGSAVTATENMAYDVIQPMSQQLVFENTSLTWNLTSSYSGKSLSGTETPYVADAASYQLTANDNTSFQNTKIIASPVNSTNFMSGAKSIKVNAAMASSNPNVSPVIDISRSSAVLVNNRINFPTAANNSGSTQERRVVVNQTTTGFVFVAPLTVTATYTAGSALVTIASGTPVVGQLIQCSGFAPNTAIVQAVSGTTVTMSQPAIATGASINTTFVGTVSSTVAGVQSLLKTVGVGQYIIFAGTTSNNNTYFVQYIDNISTNNPILSLTGATVVAETSPTTAISLTAIDKFFDEITPIASNSIAKYMSKMITLNNPSTYVKIVVSAAVGVAADLAFYYRTNPVGNTTPFDTVPFFLAQPDAPIVKNNNGKMSDITYSIPNNAAFDAVQIKIVMRSTSSASIVQLKDLRIIACA